MRERRGLGEVPREKAHLAAGDPLEQRAQPFAVHRLVEAVAEGLVDQRVVDRLEGTGPSVVLAGDLRGEHLREQVVGAHAQDVERNLAAAAVPEQRERSGRAITNFYFPTCREFCSMRQNRCA